MKMLSYQHFSLYENGGGSRILRRLYEGHEDNISSLSLVGSKKNSLNGDIPETQLLLKPILRPWMRWKLRTQIVWMQNSLFRKKTLKSIRDVADTIPHDTIHTVDHGSFSDALHDYARENKKDLWTSFHDHFTSTGGSKEATSNLWVNSKRRLVISQELGKEYQRLFGNLNFEIITDGLNSTEISKPKLSLGNTNIVYFAGLLHIDYLPLFKVFSESLNELVDLGFDISLILRGTQQVDFLNSCRFKTFYRPFTLDHVELKSEMDTADILYLPMKFTDEAFYSFSMSTKMISYLGAPGVILYHGPLESAACRLLSNASSAVCSSDLDSSALTKSLLDSFSELYFISKNAKDLAERQFDLNKIKNRFWALC